MAEDEITFLRDQVKFRDTQFSELITTVKTQAESINADRNNELAGTLIDGQRKMIDKDTTPKKWWQFWK